ncbi:unnamed protein product [Bursaphelenchus xylophilus]|uniref:(pine wood nematode) hypothetical protein n=1 Tax=Bursaphelenchus xylophilus TaxID=6326 RepID=A0A1I7S0C6_BURXY|nr:unnamed protein product [Bursaphelenchus xylophilus]CAG9132203.1 unnamed protein product [Bursaphelenchus xylophilus]
MPTEVLPPDGARSPQENYGDSNELSFLKPKDVVILRKGEKGVHVFRCVDKLSNALMINVVTREAVWRNPITRAATDGTGAAPGQPARARSTERGRNEAEAVTLSDTFY